MSDVVRGGEHAARSLRILSGLAVPRGAEGVLVLPMSLEHGRQLLRQLNGWANGSADPLAGPTYLEVDPKECADDVV